MFRNERLNNLTDSLLTALHGWQADMQTAMPGIIESYDPTTMTVTVQPALKAQITSQVDGSKTWVQLPLLLDCPVFFPSGGGFTLTFPIAQGDECLVVFSSRCIDSWWQSGGIQNQATLRMHDLSDGFALVGVRSQVRLIPNLSTTSTVLRSDTGTSFVEVQGSNINITTPSNVTINCANATVNASTGVTLNTPATHCTGNLTVDGTALVKQQLTGQGGMAISGGTGASVSGSMTITGGDVKADGVGLKSHTHSDPQGGTVGPATG